MNLFTRGLLAISPWLLISAQAAPQFAYSISKSEGDPRPFTGGFLLGAESEIEVSATEKITAMSFAWLDPAGQILTSAELIPPTNATDVRLFSSPSENHFLLMRLETDGSVRWSTYLDFPTATITLQDFHNGDDEDYYVLKFSLQLNGEFSQLLTLSENGDIQSFEPDLTNRKKGFFIVTELEDID